MFRILLAALFSCATVMPGSAEIIVKSYGYYTIGNAPGESARPLNTLEEFTAELNERGPKVDSTGMRHPGRAEMQISTRLWYEQKNGRCKIIDAKVTVDAKLTLPQWPYRDHAGPDSRLVWDSLSADIRRHEEQHVEIAREHARQIEKRVKRMWRQKDCATADHKAKIIIDGVLKKEAAAQDKFDRVEGANFQKRLIRLMRERARKVQSGQIAG